MTGLWGPSRRIFSGGQAYGKGEIFQPRARSESRLAVRPRIRRRWRSSRLVAHADFETGASRLGQHLEHPAARAGELVRDGTDAATCGPQAENLRPARRLTRHLDTVAAVDPRELDRVGKADGARKRILAARVLRNVKPSAAKVGNEPGGGL